MQIHMPEAESPGRTISLCSRAMRLLPERYGPSEGF